jgi:hypothetical protein
MMQPGISTPWLFRLAMKDHPDDVISQLEAKGAVEGSLGQAHGWEHACLEPKLCLKKAVVGWA